MTNFYEVLSTADTKLNRSDSVATLRSKLIVLESLWTDRAAQRPEKAMEMLNLINQAKKVFADEKSKAAYDNDLFAPQKQEKRADPNAARQAEFIKWHRKALEYAMEKQYDLAKTAVEQAMQYQTGDDYDFMHTAAMIYRDNHEYQPALNCINKAILLAPQKADFYVVKARVFEGLYISEYKTNPAKSAEYLRQACNTAETASQMAAKANDFKTKANADGLLAFFLYFHAPQDVVRAEKLAQSAARYGDANAKRVLETISAAREQEQKQRRANEYAELERLEAEEKRREAQERENQQRRAAAERAAQQQREKAALKKKVEKERKVYVILTALLPILTIVWVPILFPQRNLSSGGYIVFALLLGTEFLFNYSVNAMVDFAVGWKISTLCIAWGVAALLYRWYLHFPWSCISASDFMIGFVAFAAAGVIGLIAGIIRDKQLQKKSPDASIL